MIINAINVKLLWLLQKQRCCQDFFINQLNILKKVRLQNTYLLFVTEFDEIEYLPISKSMYPFRMRKSNITFADPGATSGVVISFISSLHGTSSNSSTSPSLLKGWKDLGSSKSKK